MSNTKHRQVHRNPAPTALPRTMSYQPNRSEPARVLTPDDEHRPSKIKRLFFSFILLIFVGVIVLAVWDARNLANASNKLFGSGNLFSLVAGGQLKQNDDGRVNVLLIGYSVDDPGHSGANLTDSIILLSMSAARHTGYILSIPRDLYVDIPGFGHAKINEAYEDGGASLLEKIVETNFNTPVDYYALINYASVRDTVNALGGITVDIQSSDPRGLYDPNINTADGGPLKLANGPQTLDGQTALNLTRARGDAVGSYGFAQADFDRTEHQRLVLAAIKAKINWKLILNPSKNGAILSATADNVKTDIDVGGARPLFGLFNSIPQSKLESLSLRQLDGHNYLTSYTTPLGQSALIPAAGIDDYSQIDNTLSSRN